MKKKEKKSEDKLSWVIKQYEEYKKDTEIQIWDLEDELFAWKSEYKKLKKENKKLREELQEWLNAVWNK